MSVKTPLIQTLLVAFDILDTIAQGGGSGSTLSDISEKLGIHKSTALRMLCTLESLNCVVHDIDTGRYRLGVHLLELGSTVLEGLDLRREAKPFLQELSVASGEIVHLAILDQESVVYIEKIEAPHVLTLYSRVGRRAPATCTAVGKVLLAHAKGEFKDCVTRASLVKYTEGTITEPGELVRELNDVKKNGYAIDNEEHEEHVRCVAAPIRNHQGEVIAAVSITGPSVRMTMERIQELVPLVMSGASAISKRLGFVPFVEE
jgi:IclR family KDG regulon transcriptional repressor